MGTREKIIWFILVVFFTEYSIDLATLINDYAKVKWGSNKYVHDFIILVSGGNKDNLKGFRKLALEELLLYGGRD